MRFPQRRLSDMTVAVVIPCFRVRDQILGVIARIGENCNRIYVVDDCCPESSGKLVQQSCSDQRVTVIFHEKNQGVGGAMITGYLRAISDGAEVIVKIDGDGQMDPGELNRFIQPILSGRADYTKGNRFYNIEDVMGMPAMRLLGNAVLSFLTKLSSGYWRIFDPTNGYTAISAKVAGILPLHRIRKRYFFESDMLFRLGTVRACVLDIPMKAIYGEEKSNLKIHRVIGEFFWNNMLNIFKRLFYNYFLRDFSVASLELLFGLIFLVFGVVFGVVAWWDNAGSGIPTPTGTVMLAALPIILGIQFLLSFFAFDVGSSPTTAITPLLTRPTSNQLVRAPRAEQH
jgi:dolichol-phosphate mannosyltransferase